RSDDVSCSSVTTQGRRGEPPSDWPFAQWFRVAVPSGVVASRRKAGDLHMRTFAEQNDSRYRAGSLKNPAWEAAMIDLKTVEAELQQARQARIDAEAANAEVEELIWQVQHVQLGRPHVVFSIHRFPPP